MYVHEGLDAQGTVYTKITISHVLDTCTALA